LGFEEKRSDRWDGHKRANSLIRCDEEHRTLSLSGPTLLFLSSTILAAFSWYWADIVQIVVEWQFEIFLHLLNHRMNDDCPIELLTVPDSGCVTLFLKNEFKFKSSAPPAPHQVSNNLSRTIEPVHIKWDSSRSSISSHQMKSLK
jgi:hypothetical protein